MPASSAGESAPAVGCFEKARSLALGRTEALRLCSQADSLGPARCFERARDSSLIGRSESIELCRCARSTAPIDCFLQARDTTTLGQNEAIRLCFGSGQHRALTYACFIEQTEEIP